MTTALNKLQLGAFALMGAVTTASVLAACITEAYYLALIPFALIIAYLAITDFKLLYFFLLVTIPISMEYSFTPTLGTDLPDEPLMIGLMFVTLLFLLSNYKSLPTGFFANFLIVALFIHLFWILASAINSVNFAVSIKVFFTKIWYVTTFCILTAIVIRTKKDLLTAFWCIFIPLTLLIIQVIIRHAMQGFSFEDINKPMYPFFRNHVNYAAIVSIFFPFIIWARLQYSAGSGKRTILTLSLVLYVAAIYLSYTRTCYIALLLIYPVYFIIKHRLMKPAFAVAGIVIVSLAFYLFQNNTYLKFAPEFSETIIHDELGAHLSSTLEGKDVSSMERIYRWVAAVKMFQQNPIMGFGPGNFHPYYKRYTVTSFETYVSDNPEMSTAHNYPLLLLAEQGAIGLATFVFLTLVIFIYGETIYHRLISESDKQIALTLLLVLAMIYVNLLLSDLLESDKVGPFFFICIAVLVSLDIKNRNLLKADGK